DSDDQLLALSDGGSGTAAGASVAGSVNLNRLRGSERPEGQVFREPTPNVTQAAVGDRTVAHIGGDVLVRADNASTVVSVAGASSATTNGFLAVGAALDLGDTDVVANAFVGSEATLQAAGNVSILSNSDEDMRSVSASVARANGAGEATRLYRNNGTAAPFAGVTGTNVTGDRDLTTAVALADLD